MFYDYRCGWCGHEWSSPMEPGDWESCPACHGSYSFSGLAVIRERKWKNLEEWRELLWWRDRMSRTLPPVDPVDAVHSQQSVCERS